MVLVQINGAMVYDLTGSAVFPESLIRLADIKAGNQKP
jgi:hypothetical protein